MQIRQKRYMSEYTAPMVSRWEGKYPGNADQQPAADRSLENGRYLALPRCSKQQHLRSGTTTAKRGRLEPILLEIIENIRCLRSAISRINGEDKWEQQLLSAELFPVGL